MNLHIFIPVVILSVGLGAPIATNRRDSTPKGLKLWRFSRPSFVNPSVNRLRFKTRADSDEYRTEVQEDVTALKGTRTKEEDGSGDRLKSLVSLKYDNNIQVFPLKPPDQGIGALKVPKLPPGEFKPRKSLGQNFITDLNLMNKMCNSLQHYTEDPGDGSHVVELGCGIGSLTQILHKKYKKMTGIEIDARAVSQLSRTIPGLHLVNDDVVQVDYGEISKKIGKKLWIIGNLPFYITSQILFCLLDYRKYIDRAVVTAQLEVARRIVARKDTKEYSILSLVFQTFADCKILFKIPSQAFYPKPKVDAACVYIKFNKPNPFALDSEEQGLAGSRTRTFKLNLLKQIIRDSFNQKRKKLKSSLHSTLSRYGVELPEEYLDKRPQNLSSQEFIDLTNLIYSLTTARGGFLERTGLDGVREKRFVGRIWRREKHGPGMEMGDLIV